MALSIARPARAATTLVIALGWLLFAQGAFAAHPTGEADPAALYHNYCSVCHGDKGDGRSRASSALVPAPRDFTNDASRRELSKERIFSAIKYGRPGTAMVSWSTQLSDADMQKLTDYVLATFVKKEQPLVPPAISGTRAHGGRSGETPAVAAPAQANLTAPFPNNLKGDAKKGRVFYQANCATCHGARGDGQGPRAYFINPKPKSFVDDVARSRYSRPALYAFVSEGKLGTEMPAWRQVIDAQQIADVAEYVLQSFVSAPPPPASAAAKK